MVGRRSTPTDGRLLTLSGFTNTIAKSWSVIMIPVVAAQGLVLCQWFFGVEFVAPDLLLFLSMIFQCFFGVVLEMFWSFKRTQKKFIIWCCFGDKNDTK